MVAVSAAVGVRLLALARRSRKLPELVMAIASLGTGIGATLVVLGVARAEAQQPSSVALIYAGIIMTSTGSIFLCAGMWRIFRVNELWAVALTLVAGVLLVVSCSVLLGVDHSGHLPTEHPAYWLGFGVRIATFGWVAAESLHYARQLQRRAALGLAEPLMANRFLCWGVSSVSSCIAYLIYLGCMLSGEAPPAHALALIGALGLVSGGSMWIAFFPPGLYRQRAGASTR